ncbi:MAG: hypothetical protein ABSG27_06290 [Candidatus Acidiferrales bacterium]|jgi:hypothetical protein
MARRTALERALEWLFERGDSPAPRAFARSGNRGRRRRGAGGRHGRKCKVCRHPDRDAIERDFLRWRSPDRIAEDYGIADHSSVYRHAHATGLFARRAATIRLALEPIIERAVTVNVTADAVVRAVYVVAHLNGSGQWVEQPSHIVHHSQRDAITASASAEQTDPNRQSVRAEHDPSH